MGGFFPEGHFPEGHFPEGHFPETEGVAADANRVRFSVRAPRTRFTVYLLRAFGVSNSSQQNYLVEVAEKNSTTDLAVELSLYDFCAQKWQANEDVAANEFVLPTRPTGFAYEASAATRTGVREPRWPTTLGATVTDGSVTWTCRAASTNALNAISDESAESDPEGLTITGVSVSETFKLRATYQGGTEGCDYDAVFDVTINARPMQFRQRVQVRRQ